MKNTPKKPKSVINKTTPCGRHLPTVSYTLAEQAKLIRDMTGRMETYAQVHKLKNSDVRRKILETIVIEANHFTAMELLERVQQRYDDVSRATLYRTLPIFVESGILEEGPTDASGQPLYELAHGDHHDHIVCLDCRQIFEFHDDTIEKQQEKVSSSLSFVPTGHRHVIFAKCGLLKTGKNSKAAK